jgi:DNA-binding MarR family transcriptional regulator
MGLIERALSTADRRQFHIRLTAAGTEMVRRLSPDHANALNQLADGLDAVEVVQLTHLLDKLCASIVQAGNLTLPCPSHPTNHTELGEHPV